MEVLFHWSLVDGLLDEGGRFLVPTPAVGEFCVKRLDASSHQSFDIEKGSDKPF